jgi:hypothetical protein
MKMVCIYVCMHVCMYVCGRMKSDLYDIRKEALMKMVCMYVYIYIYIYAFVDACVISRLRPVTYLKS